MKLTRAATYALHALVYMATQENGKTPVASHDIAAARGIPERFLLKVLKPLVDHDLLSSVKGPNGGYTLRRPASEITLLDVLEAVDGPIHGGGPLLEGGNVKEDRRQERAPLNQKLEQICLQTADALRSHLEKITISELIPA